MAISHTPSNNGRYSIAGKVLIQGTDQGAANLLAVIYDIDPKYSLAELFSQPQVKAISWDKFPGNRIGSVITDSLGEFTLEYNEDDFRPNDQEKKPDLVLFILLPEQPTPGLTAENEFLEQLVFFTRIPRTNAGRTESYIINIPKERLQKSSYFFPGSIDIKELEKSLDADAETSKAVRLKLEEQLAARLKQEDNTLQEARSTFKDFSLSKVDIGDRYYAARDTNITLKQDAIIKEALSTYWKNRNVPSEGDNAALSLKKRTGIRFTGKLKEEVEKHIVNGEVPLLAFQKLFRQHLNVLDLTSRKTLVEACLSEASEQSLEEREIERIINSILDDATLATDLPTPTDISANGTIPTIGNQLNDLLRDFKCQGTTEPHSNGQRPSQGDIEKSISEVNFKGGLAERPSFHDFYHLQIAFDHVWTELFDGKIKDLGVTLQNYKLKLTGYIGAGITNEEGLKDLLDELTELAKLAKHNTSTPQIVNDMLFFPSQYYNVLTVDEQASLVRYAESTRDWKKQIAILAEKKGYEGVVLGSSPHLADGHRMLEIAKARYEEFNDQSFENSKLHKVITELHQRLASNYKFDIFFPNSVNYGLLLNYRQEWVPLGYQAGDLVSTIPLAPKETKKYTKKKVVKKSRSVKEVEDSLHIKKSESAVTGRAESEIVDKATKSNKFSMNASLNGNQAESNGSAGNTFGSDGQPTFSSSESPGGVSGEAGASYGFETANESSNIKKNFREAVLKASEEYKQERKLEVDTKSEEEYEETYAGEISNPNDEITVTYLFYELQRRFSVSEKLHRVRPVVLVANSVPAPHEIDEDWIIAHDWILKRVLLDDSFLPAIQFLGENAVGDEFALRIYKAEMERQAALVENIEQQIGTLRETAKSLLREVNPSIKKTGTVAKEIASAALNTIDETFTPGGLIGTAVKGIGRIFKKFRKKGGNNDDNEQPEEEYTYNNADYLQAEMEAMRGRLSTEVTALRAATERYTSLLKDFLNRQTEILKLQVHIKQNILYYMQAIWDHEPTDQRFLRLYKLTAPMPEPTAASSIRVSPGSSAGPFGLFPELGVEIPLPATVVKTPKLAQVADLNNMLGYMGNYMVFPLKESNFVTDMMMMDYVDEKMGLIDPDPLGNYTMDELIAYMKDLYKKDAATYRATEPQFRDLIRKKLQAPYKEKDEVVVPTDSLYIEALPGAYPILEDFKLRHRQIDVLKVMAEVRHRELENVRLEKRITTGELSDPDIEKRVEIIGSAESVAIDTE